MPKQIVPRPGSTCPLREGGSSFNSLQPCTEGFLRFFGGTVGAKVHIAREFHGVWRSEKWQEPAKNHRAHHARQAVHRLSQGQLMGSGTNTFGYDYIRKSPTNLPRMVVNEREAAIVRRVFETYASTQIALEKIAQQLEEEGVLTKKGRKLWRRSFLKTMLNSFLPNTWS